MKRRLRKKLRLGEFRQDCFEVQFRVDPSLDSEVMGAFIEMIEANGLQCGGGGKPGEWSCVVQGPGSRGSTTAEDRACVLEWLQAPPDIMDVCVGPLCDAWYGWRRRSHACRKSQ